MNVFLDGYLPIVVDVLAVLALVVLCVVLARLSKRLRTRHDDRVALRHPNWYPASTFSLREIRRLRNGR